MKTMPLACLLILSPPALFADIANGGYILTQDIAKEVKRFVVGDLVEIEISESSESTYRESGKGSKNTQVEATLDSWVRLSRERTHRESGGMTSATRLKPSAPDQPEIDFESSQNYSNQSQEDRRSSFRERIMCMIKEVRPNGNVYIEGIKEFREDDKYRKLIFSGEISQDDLVSKQVIPSTRVYNPNAEVVERGPHKDAVKKTFLQRFLHWIWPF